MNLDEMYPRIRSIANQLGRRGGYNRGRRTGNAQYDDFLRQLRLNSAALKRFSLSDRRVWGQLVHELNTDLTGHWYRQAREQRVESRKLTTSPGVAASLRKWQAKRMEAKARRIAAITIVCERLRKQGKKPTVKAVNRMLEKDFPALDPIRPDTLRKDLHRLKVACQSG